MIWHVLYRTDPRYTDEEADRYEDAQEAQREAALLNADPEKHPDTVWVIRVESEEGQPES